MELKVPPRPDKIAELYSRDVNRLREDVRNVLDGMLADEEVAPLFEEYRKIMKTLYPQGGMDLVKKLFIDHTLMHMMVMASLSAVLDRVGEDIDTSSGNALPAGLSIALPHLNWWRISYERMSREHQEAIRRVAATIAGRAQKVNWDLESTEDVFRQLYELLIETRIRRNIGEYYTPLPLVDRILSEFSLKGKIVMDPFCGSGTFLVRAFHKKVKEGESPEKAYEGVIGIDINPLAVAVARAELIISYVRATSKEPRGSLRLPNSSPRVYHADTLAAWYGGGFGLFSPQALRAIKPDIIATNPPWIHITEYKAVYVEKMRETLKRALTSSLGIPSRKASTLVLGSDVSTAALYKALSIAREGVGFIMSRNQSFSSKSSVHAGIITTYAVLKSTCSDCLVKLIDVDYDAFGHGMNPGIVIAIKGKG